MHATDDNDTFAVFISRFTLDDDVDEDDEDEDEESESDDDDEESDEDDEDEDEDEPETWQVSAGPLKYGGA
jgi:hypothetical protein